MKPSSDTLIVSLYESGNSISDIARHLHVSSSYIRSVLVTNGITIRPRGRSKEAAK